MIRDELEKAYPENQNAKYRIVENGKNDYKVIFSAKNGLGGVISIFGHNVNYKIDFENNPYVIFNFFEGEDDLEKIDGLFEFKCYRFTFRYCIFSGKRWLKKVLKWYDKIEHSSIFVPKNFFETMKQFPKEQYKLFMDNTNAYGNTIYINRCYDTNEINFKDENITNYINKYYSKVRYDFVYDLIDFTF